MHHNVIDLTGQVFGDLTVLNYVGKTDSGASWECLCVCGKKTVTRACTLKSGKVNSCGCRRSQGLVDLTGKRFGSLVALHHLKEKNGKSKWMCKCDCGKTKAIRGDSLRAGTSKTCGCHGPLDGQRFGRLIVLRESGKQGHCLAICDCGEEKEVKKTQLKAGQTRSCGCLARETLRTHGASKEEWFGSWSSMMSRCNNPKDYSYHRYGGAGIKVCERWKDPYAFYSDIGDKPSSSHSLDRIDRTKGYSKDNVRWATFGQQVANRSITVLTEEMVFKMRAMYSAGCPVEELHEFLAPKGSLLKNTRRAVWSATNSIKTWLHIPWPTEDEIQAILDGEEVDMQRFAA